MAGPFDFLNIGGFGQPSHPDPIAAQATESTSPWLRMFGLGAMPEEVQAGRERLIQLDQQKVMSELSAKAAELSRTAPNRAELARQLLQDPVGMKAISTLPHEQIKSVFDTVLMNVKPDMATGALPDNSTLWGMWPGGPPQQLGQGGYETTTQNPVGDEMSTTKTPGRIFGPATTPPALGPGSPAPAGPAPAAPGPMGGMTMPPGFAMTQPFSPPTQMASKLPSAPAAMEPGAEPSTWYEAVISAEGTAVRGNPYDEVLGYGKWGLPDRPLTQMTVGEVKKFGLQMRAAQAATGVPWEKTSSASGAFQIVGNTMELAQKGLGIPDSAPFNEDTQRRMADWIRKNQGFGAWEGFKANPQALQQAQFSVGEQPTGQPIEGPRDVLETATADMGPVITDKDLSTLAEENPAFYFLGTGFPAWVARGLGRAGRQLDTKEGNIQGTLAGVKAKHYQARLNHAVLTTREGREDMREGTALSALVPNFGPGNDPVASLEEGISLYDYATKKRAQRLEEYNDPLMPKDLKIDSAKEYKAWGNVLSELGGAGGREAMEGLKQQLINDPHTVNEIAEGHPLVTPGQLWRILTNEGPAAVGKAISDPVNAPYFEGNAPEVEKMDMPTVQSMEPDALRSWVQNVPNDVKGALPLDVKKAIIAKLKAAGTVQPQR